MANPVYRSYTTTGAQAPVVLDWMIAPFQATVAVYIASGAASFQAEYTLDDINGTAPVRWIVSTQIPNGTSANIIAAVTTPIFAVRLNLASNTGTVELKVLQGYTIN